MDLDSSKEATSNFLSTAYNYIAESIPEKYRVFLILGFYIILMAIYCIFIWKFYKFLARRDIIRIDLSKYNTSTHPGLRKFFATLLFLAQYIIILPFLISFWFIVLALFLLILAKNQDIRNVILVSAALIGSTRLTAYISEDLSKDLAKMLPFTLLGIFLIDPNFFSVTEFISKIYDIPNLLSDIFYYLVFIFLLEIVLRGFYSLADLFSGGELSLEKESS